MTRRSLRVFPLVWLALVAPLFAQAQQAPQKRNPYAGSPFLWDMDSVMDDYVRKLSKYYNLTTAQEEATRKLLTQRVKRFMGDYERDVRSMLAEMVEYQIRREIPPAEIAKDWAARGKPLVGAIRSEIMEGTMQWRNILTEEQKKLHDKDLQALDREFGSYDDRFERWSHGDVRETDFGPGRVSNNPPRIRKGEDAWASYVRSFCAAYNLDVSQRESAESVLRELREEAQKYREAHKDDFAKLEADFAAVNVSKPDASKEELEKRRDERIQLNKRQQELEKRITVDMYSQLKERLERIPTADQRKTRDSQMSRLREMVQNRRRESTSRPAATSKPSSAETQPAQAAAQ